MGSMKGHSMHARGGLQWGHGPKETPREAPAHVFSPGQPHFPVSPALVYFHGAAYTPHRHTPLQTQRSPAHPGDWCLQRKTRSITHPAQQAVETGCRRAPRACPWSWVAAGGGGDGGRRGSATGLPGTEDAGGRWGGPLWASKSQVWKRALSSVEQRGQEWEIQKYTLCINQGSTWKRKSICCFKRQDFRLNSHLLERPKGEPEASGKQWLLRVVRPLREGVQEWDDEKSGGPRAGSRLRLSSLTTASEAASQSVEPKGTCTLHATVALRTKCCRHDRIRNSGE